MAAVNEVLAHTNPHPELDRKNRIKITCPAPARAMDCAPSPDSAALILAKTNWEDACQDREGGVIVGCALHRGDGFLVHLKQSIRNGGRGVLAFTTVWVRSAMRARY